MATIAGEGVPGDSEGEESVSPPPRKQIGPYRILEMIGSGGMGDVYIAEQTEPVQRKVALKIVRPGMGSEEIISRFETERQALALMDHAHIAKVFDAGTEEKSGLPYFVMELVLGLPITEFCDQRKLNIGQRLELFVLVCRAVQHAHQKGVIHRDLKPNNILVEEREAGFLPKVIDFGIAKAIDSGAPELTLCTLPGQVVGTMQYMSPEQAELGSIDIDTRSDVYSLGVILYELLTGMPPLDSSRLRESGFEEMLRLVREEEASRPSLYLQELSREDLSTLAERRDTDLHGMTFASRGDLDWIALKTLDKERNRRYETANALAADIQRYLENQPIVARPPTAMYRLGKFARRNTGLLAAVSSIILVLVAGVVFSSFEAIRANKAEADALSAQGVAEEQAALAEKSRRDALELVSFLNSEIQSKLNQRGDDEAVRKIVEAIDQYFLENAHLSLDLAEQQIHHSVLANGGYKALSRKEFERADDYSLRALRIAEDVQRRLERPFVTGMYAGAVAVRFEVLTQLPDTSRRQEAMDLLESTLSKALPEQKIDLLMKQASFFGREKETKKQLEVQLEAMKHFESSFPDPAEGEGIAPLSRQNARLRLRNQIASSYTRLNEREKSAEYSGRAIDLAKRMLKTHPDHVGVIEAIYHASFALGQYEALLGNQKAADEYYRGCIEHADLYLKYRSAFPPQWTKARALVLLTSLTEIVSHQQRIELYDQAIALAEEIAKTGNSNIGEARFSEILDRWVKDRARIASQGE